MPPPVATTSPTPTVTALPGWCLLPLPMSCSMSCKQGAAITLYMVVIEGLIVRECLGQIQNVHRSFHVFMEQAGKLEIASYGKDHGESLIFRQAEVSKRMRNHRTVSCRASTPDNRHRRNFGSGWQSEKIRCEVRR